MRRSLFVLALALTTVVPAAAEASHRNPRVDFTVTPSSAQTGQTVRFDASASRCHGTGGWLASNCSAYTWQDDGDPNDPLDSPASLGTGRVMSRSFQTVGTKYVWLTVQDSSGRLTRTATDLQVTAATPPPPTASFTVAPASPQRGQQVTLDASGSSCAASPCTYNWDDVNGGTWPLGSGQTVRPAFDTVGDKHVRLTVTDALGRVAQAQRVVTVVAPPDPDPDPDPEPSSCDLNATPSNLSAQIGAASAGQTICLASGSYGSFAGTGKRVTLRMADGASGTMSLSLSGSADGNFTIDGNRAFGASGGLTLTGANITGAVHDVTVTRVRSTGHIVFRSPHPHPNVVLDRIEMVEVPNSTPAVWLPGGSNVHSGVTIQNSYCHDISGDCIQTGPAIDVLNNVFARLDLAGTSAHSDAVQLYTGSGDGVGSTLRGNLVRECEQGLVAFDGSGDHVIEDNVVWNCRVHGIVLGGDRPGSIVRHNTVGGSGRNQIDCSSKAGFQPSITAIYDNVAQYVGLDGAVDCVPSRNDHNLVRQGASGGNFLGSPVFVGGANPSGYAGFRLAPGSPGKGAASDGLDVGIR
jgi:hypothetical protein